MYDTDVGLLEISNCILKEVLIFAGTTEGRKLSEYLVAAGIHHTMCVATEYGEIVLRQHPCVKVHQGRMTQKEIEQFIAKGRFAAIVDATHPFAMDITRNIKVAIHSLDMQGITVLYLRLKREGISYEESDRIYFKTNEECAEALQHTEGNILLTIGSKELPRYCAFAELKRRLFVRVLPGMESISRCVDQGICGKQIIAMQGPFSIEMNEATIHQYHISYLVTKETGVTGGYPEKLEAAKRAGIQTWVIGCPKEKEAYSFSEVCDKLSEICGIKVRIEDLTERFFEREGMRKSQDPLMEIVLAGIGMGHESCLTKEVEKVISEADLLLGAARMLENLDSKAEKRAVYQAEQIVPYLEDRKVSGVLRVAILFSGDSGFYSGCQSLYAVLKKEIQEGRLKAFLRIVPGISSVAYLASCIGESYQDAAVYSMHGKKLCNLARRIKNSPKTFLLTSGVKDVQWLGKMLIDNSMMECEVTTGYQLSYEEQRIDQHTPAECCTLREEGLYTCFIKNPYAENKQLTHGRMDEEFIRGHVPMSKEEVREVSICKLRLQERAVVYDIGSGTGSVAVEMASLSDYIQVYAVEQKEEAVSLIEKNREKFGLQNITVVKTMAPEGLSGLPVATHAFIGGSSGKLKEILATLRQINPKMRVVINAVCIETICEMKEILSLYEVKDEEIVQLQVSRARKIGSCHLMCSENPIWICAFDFAGS